MKKFTSMICAALIGLAAHNVSAQDTVANKTITITAVGDIMLGSIVPDKSYCPPNMDASHLLDEVRPYFDSSDVVFCNVEGTFTDTKLGAKNCNDPKTCFTFGMPRKFANCFKDAGFNLVSVANNHSGDFGEYGKTNKPTKA